MNHDQNRRSSLNEAIGLYAYFKIYRTLAAVVFKGHRHRTGRFQKFSVLEKNYKSFKIEYPLALQ